MASKKAKNLPQKEKMHRSSEMRGLQKSLQKCLQKSLHEGFQNGLQKGLQIMSKFCSRC